MRDATGKERAGGAAMDATRGRRTAGAPPTRLQVLRPRVAGASPPPVLVEFGIPATDGTHRECEDKNAPAPLPDESCLRWSLRSVVWRSPLFRLVG